MLVVCKGASPIYLVFPLGTGSSSNVTSQEGKFAVKLPLELPKHSGSTMPLPKALMFWTMVFQFTFSGNVVTEKYDFQKTPVKSNRLLLKSIQILSYQKKTDMYLSFLIVCLLGFGLKLSS